MQVKVRITDPDVVLEAINGPGLELLYNRHYHEYDVYFIFDDPDQGILRYREDEYIDENDEITNVRYRLTMIGPAREAQYDSDVLLSRSRYIAPATHSRRLNISTLPGRWLSRNTACDGGFCSRVQSSISISTGWMSPSWAISWK